MHKIPVLSVYQSVMVAFSCNLKIIAGNLEARHPQLVREQDGLVHEAAERGVFLLPARVLANAPSGILL